MRLQKEQENVASAINNLAEVHSIAFEMIAATMNEKEPSTVDEINVKLDASRGGDMTNSTSGRETSAKKSLIVGKR